jgi:hypothetical protein
MLILDLHQPFTILKKHIKLFTLKYSDFQYYSLISIQELKTSNLFVAINLDFTYNALNRFDLFHQISRIGFFNNIAFRFEDELTTLFLWWFCFLKYFRDWILEIRFLWVCMLRTYTLEFSSHPEHSRPIRLNLKSALSLGLLFTLR